MASKTVIWHGTKVMLLLINLKILAETRSKNTGKKALKQTVCRAKKT